MFFLVNPGMYVLNILYIENVGLPFSGKESSLVKDREEQIARLERKVGNLMMERDFLCEAYKKAVLKRGHVHVLHLSVS